ncbi:Enamine deaminase RidA, house cleaning of reactive enamine intermediates, YjgF/YER057c/UK114 family [Micromonospora echinospora]|uniref:Enamine deaminase RidA, house cleaning of reactive enamine intermediates, YjgF/YER057c/UK114 family n=1 Tax=Micromonospora echinospora TaxID=1877 RepID=A0A1C4Z0U9_MICEC|nr:Enamine deaminase RidA, house cleaning of reactive enamine intermediates, YjgF/YER057c/UK114 family [Micromonospora echinospora]
MVEQIDPASRLAAAGVDLPVPPEPLANYVPATRSGLVVHTSGQLPLRAGHLLHRGKLGRDVTVEEGRECSRQAAINALAAVAAVAGGLGRVASVVRMVVYVASDPSFTAQPKVADGASELLDLAFGSRGRHARSAVGVAVLPLDAPVEVELVVELVPRHAAPDE